MNHKSEYLWEQCKQMAFGEMVNPRVDALSAWGFLRADLKWRTHGRIPALFVF